MNVSWIPRVLSHSKRSLQFGVSFHSKGREQEESFPHSDGRQEEDCRSLTHPTVRSVSTWPANPAVMCPSPRSLPVQSKPSKQAKTASMCNFRPFRAETSRIKGIEGMTTIPFVVGACRDGRHREVRKHTGRCTLRFFILAYLIFSEPYFLRTKFSMQHSPVISDSIASTTHSSAAPARFIRLASSPPKTTSATTAVSRRKKPFAPPEQQPSRVVDGYTGQS